jgi:hypothetical protein
LTIMPSRYRSISPAFGCLALTMTLACGGKHAIRTAAPDAAQSHDASPAVEVSGDQPTSTDEGAAAEGGTRDSVALAEHGLDEAGRDAPADQGSGQDSPMDGAGQADAGLDGGGMSQVDGGLDGGGMFQCNFAGVSPGLACADGQYCSSFIGGPIGSVATYSCGTLPAACLSNRTCECLCPRGSTGWSCADPARSYANCNCIASQGSLTLMCAAP